MKIKILSVCTAILLLICNVSCNNKANTDTSESDKSHNADTTYAEIMTSPERLDIQINISDDLWNNMIKNAEEKKFYSCDVTINGEKLTNVGIRTKGSASLETAMWSGSDRYSFMLKFDKYDKKQKYHGLSKLALNNNAGDNTQLRDAVTYDMCSYIGLSAPVCNYAKISKNGEYFGCYLAVEPVDKDFCKRNYESADGALYSICQFYANDGGNLNYIDDNVASYNGIFEEEKFGSTDETKKAVIEAVKNVCNGNDIEKYVDIDNILKFLAVQAVTVNLDSITGSTTNNTMLYINDGKIRLVPWDNNLAYGGFIDEGEDFAEKDTEEEDWQKMPEDYEEYDDYEVDYKSIVNTYINFPIDTPFMTDMEKRLFFKSILENSEYLEQYHKYLNDIAENYIKGGKLKEYADRIYTEIGDIAGTEKNAFVTSDTYKKASVEFIKMLDRKADAIIGQLSGELPSTKKEQLINPDKFIKYDDINMELMGVD